MEVSVVLNASSKSARNASGRNGAADFDVLVVVRFLLLVFSKIFFKSQQRVRAAAVPPPAEAATAAARPLNHRLHRR